MMLPVSLLIIRSLKRWVRVPDISAETGKGVIRDVGMETTNQNREPKQWHMYVINKHASDNVLY